LRQLLPLVLALSSTHRLDECVFGDAGLLLSVHDG